MSKEPAITDASRPGRGKAVAWTTAGLVVLVVHWLAIVISISGPNVIRERLGSAPDLYASTLFHQKWRLFSPDPGTYSKKFLYRCQVGADSWTEWQSPIDDLLEIHYRVRVTHHGKLLRIPISFAVDLAQEVVQVSRERPCGGGDEACVERRDAHLKTRPVYGAARRYTWDRCRADAGSGPVSAAQFRLELVHIPSPDERTTGSQPRRSQYTFDPFDVGGESP